MPEEVANDFCLRRGVFRCGCRCMCVAFSVRARHNGHTETVVCKYYFTVLVFICDENVHFGHVTYENLPLLLTYF